MGAVISSGCVRMQEQEPEENPGPGEAVPSATLTVNAVTKHTDPEVKVSFGATDATWEDGDKLFLIKSDGTTITMDLDEGAGTTTGRFISTDPVTAGTYIPYAVSGTSLMAGYVTVTDGIISLDLSVPGGGTLADALAHDILKGNAVALTEGQTVATITNLSTHILSYLRFRFSCNSKSITGIGVSSAGGIATSVSIAPGGTISGQNPTTDEIDLTEVGDDGAGTYSGYFAVYGSTSTSLLAYAEDVDGGKYARLVSTKTANYSAGLVYGRDYTLTDGMVSCAAEATLSEQTWENLGLSVRWAKFNYGSADEYSYDRNVENSNNAVPAGWTGWRFPTRAEVQELFYACNRQWVSGTSNGVRFEAPNGNTLSMGAGGKYRVRDDGNDWTNGEGSDLYFYIDETTTSNGYLSRLYAVIGSEGQSLGFDYANHGGNVYSYDDYLALRLVCDYAEGVDPEKVYTDLSAGGAANCYIVPAAGDYKFRATVKGNGAGDLAGVNKDTDAGTIAKAELVWASYGTATAPLDGELIRNISYEDGYVYFSSGQVYREGNAVVAVKDGSGKILWSWHLWFTDDNIEGAAQTYPGGAVFMDRNLGALSADSSPSNYGLLYQWGRKDPFLNAKDTGSNYVDISIWNPAVLGTPKTIRSYTAATLPSIATLVETPTEFSYEPKKGWTSDLSSAGSDLWAEDKTIFDPCPPGWKVPQGAMWDTQFRNGFKMAPNTESLLVHTAVGPYSFPNGGLIATCSIFQVYSSSTVTFVKNAGTLEKPDGCHYHYWACDEALVKNTRLANSNVTGFFQYQDIYTGTAPKVSVKHYYGTTEDFPLLSLGYGASIRCVRENSTVNLPTSVSIPSSVSVRQYEAVTLPVTTTPAQCSFYETSWSSSNSSIAKVDNYGNVAGLKEGTCDITLTTPFGLSICTVTVTPMNTTLAMVDMGLPSGTLWPNMNYKATSPEDKGTLCTRSATLDSPWRLPTKEECEELLNNCTWIGNSYKGVFAVSLINGHSLYFPTFTYQGASSLEYNKCLLWTSSYDTSGGYTNFYYMYLDPDGIHYMTVTNIGYREFEVRPLQQ